MYERSADRLIQVTRDIDVANNFAFLPHRRLIPWVQGSSKGQQVTVAGQLFEVTNQLTLCNCAVSVYTAALGCPIPPMKANDQISKYLDSNEGKMAGWVECNRTAAVERAKLGYPTVMAAVAWPHGHIGLVVPNPLQPDVLHVSAAGSRNFAVAVPSIRSFSDLDAKARWWTHN